jgi:hypothetical protein
MSQVLPGRDPVPNEPLQLLDLGKSALILTRPDTCAVKANFEDASGGSVRINALHDVLEQ